MAVKKRSTPEGSRFNTARPSQSNAVLTSRDLSGVSDASLDRLRAGAVGNKNPATTGPAADLIIGIGMEKKKRGR